MMNIKKRHKETLNLKFNYTTCQVYRKGSDVHHPGSSNKPSGLCSLLGAQNHL